MPTHPAPPTWTQVPDDPVLESRRNIWAEYLQNREIES